MLARWQVVSNRGNDAEIAEFIGEMDRRDAERDERLSKPEALMQAALWYISQDIPVFPLQPRSKEPMLGSRGFKDATTDAKQVRAWWQRAPEANIGAPTGVLFDVIDIDGPSGFASLATLREEGMQFRASSLRADEGDDAGVIWIYATSFTPNRSGRHFFVEPGGGGCKPGFKEGIDYKGIGGYVVMPPSRWTDTDDRYDWIDTPRLHELRR